MKITDIKPFPVWVGHRNQHIVKVETDEGIYGWGESGLSSRELAVAGAVKHYREFFIRRDPMRIGGLWQDRNPHISADATGHIRIGKHPHAN